jgi:HAD superfamily hydrolase (TIGR01450 family)
MAESNEITIEKIIERYTVLLLDAYGVLVHASGALTGAAWLITELNRVAKPYYILTNDASKLPETMAKRYRGYGLAIDPDSIITSGSLLINYFRQKQLEDSRCVVLGPDECARYVQLAGGQVVPCNSTFDVLIIGDESGYPLLETLDTVLTGLFKQLDRGNEIHLVLPNPDLIYPKDDNSYGIASGSIALVLEAALKLRYPAHPNLHFEKLGKPQRVIYEEALRRSTNRDMVMIGDQLETDILGAIDFGLDSVLVGTGITRSAQADYGQQLRPTYYMQSIAPDPRVDRSGLI